MITATEYISQYHTQIQSQSHQAPTPNKMSQRLKIHFNQCQPVLRRGKPNLQVGTSLSQSDSAEGQLDP